MAFNSTFFFFHKLKQKSFYSLLFVKKFITFYLIFLMHSPRIKPIFLSSILPVLQIINLACEFLERRLPTHITFTQYFSSCYMLFLTSPKLDTLRKEYYSDALSYFSHSLQYFFFKYSLDFLNKYCFFKKSTEKRAFYSKDLTAFKSKPSFIRNFTRLPNRNFWKIFKTFYKEPRIYNISYRKHSKKVAYFLLTAKFLSEYFLAGASGSLLKYTTSKLNWGVCQASKIYLQFPRCYQLKAFLRCGFKRNRIQNLYKKFHLRLDFFISFSLKVALVPARLLIKQGLFTVNGFLIKKISYLLHPSDIVNIRDNWGFFALYALSSYSNFAIFKKYLKKKNCSGFGKSFSRDSLPFWFKRFSLDFQQQYFYQVNNNLISGGLLSPLNLEKPFRFQEGFSYRNQYNDGLFSLNIFYKIYRKNRQLSRINISYSLLQKWDSLYR